MRRNLLRLSDEQWKRIERQLPTDVRGFCAIPTRCATHADLELLGRPTSGSSSFHEVNDAHSCLALVG